MIINTLINDYMYYIYNMILHYIRPRPRPRQPGREPRGAPRRRLAAPWRRRVGGYVRCKQACVCVYIYIYTYIHIYIYM